MGACLFYTDACLGRLIDEQISIALETRESLVSQREILKVRAIILSIALMT